MLDTFLRIASAYNELSVATGYWDIEGMKLVLDSVSKYKKIRILIGREPLLKRDNTKGIEQPEPDYPDQDFFSDLERIAPSPELTTVVVRMKELIDQGVIEVRVYRRSFLHAKCYIFGTYESAEAIGIIGSSNFTRNGFTTNTELNALESDHRVVTFMPKNDTQETGHLSWFDTKWNDEMTEEWSGQFTELISTSKHGDTLYSPQEIYLRILYELYKQEIESQKENIIHPHAYTLFEFQERNVKNIKRMLDVQGVAMLADSVGLGKTLSCIGVIKQYKNQRVVIVAPASLKSHWEKELAKEGIFHARVISLQNRQEIEDARKIDLFAPVSLFVIDESHNLRSANATRYELLSDWIASEYNESAHVLLATATPINNSLDDLINQILLAVRGEQDIFTVPYIDSNNQVVVRSLYEVVQNIKKKLNQNAAQGASEDQIIDIYKESRMLLEPAIQSFVVRNTRESIGSLTYSDGTVVTFPEVSVKTRTYTHPALSGLDNHDFSFIHHFTNEMIGETMDTFLHPVRQLKLTSGSQSETIETRSTIYHLYQLILSLSFVPYRWRMYDARVYGKTRDEVRNIRFAKREEAQAINRQLSIYGIIRTTFLKRLESSMYALESSLNRYEKRLTLFAKILEKENAIAQISDIDDILDEYAEDTGDELAMTDEEIEQLVKDKGLLPAESLVVKELSEDIQTELALLNQIRKYVAELKLNDAKWHNFRQHILDIHQKDPKQKVLIFSFYADTISHLKDRLSNDPECSAIIKSAEFVSGATKSSAINAADRFSPIARDYILKPEEAELTYLFTTDVLSEGQNLQDAGLLINYDLHWNPVRMIQRNGRINRIGSRFEQVTIENFLPSADLDEFLALVERLRRKIELIKHAIGTDSSVLGEDTDPREYIGIYSTDEEEAKKIYERLEAETGSFAEDVFKRDLFNFYQTAGDSKRAQVERIPFGSWTKLDTLLSPQSVITMANFTLTDERTTITKPFFFANDEQANQLDLVPRALALKKIRNDIQDRPAKQFSINIGKHEDRTVTFGSDLITTTGGEEVSLTPTKQNVHAKAREYGWSAEEQDHLFTTLQTRNLHLRRKVERIARQINTALNDNNLAETDRLYKALKQYVHAPQNAPAITQTTFAFGITHS